MDRFLYIAANGNKNVMLAQAMNANNLANINTTGFRADLSAMQQVAVHGPGYDSRAYANTAQGRADLAQGTTISTGRELDVAIAGKGWIAVQAPNGTEAYTRDGNLRISPEGLLTTATGHPVMGNRGPIAVPPAAKVEIGSDGTISILPVGQQIAALAIVDRIKLVDPAEGGLQKNQYGLFQLEDGAEAPAEAGIRLESGALESSNVNAVEALVTMIGLARQFELNTKLMKTAEEHASASAQLMRLS